MSDGKKSEPNASQTFATGERVVIGRDPDVTAEFYGGEGTIVNWRPEIGQYTVLMAKPYPGGRYCFRPAHLSRVTPTPGVDLGGPTDLGLPGRGDSLHTCPETDRPNVYDLACNACVENLRFNGFHYPDERSTLTAERDKYHAQAQDLEKVRPFRKGDRVVYGNQIGQQGTVEDVRVIADVLWDGDEVPDEYDARGLNYADGRPAPPATPSSSREPDPRDVALDEILHIVRQSYHSVEMREDIATIIERVRSTPKGPVEPSSSEDKESEAEP